VLRKDVTVEEQPSTELDRARELALLGVPVDGANRSPEELRDLRDRQEVWQAAICLVAGASERSLDEVESPSGFQSSASRARLRVFGLCHALSMLWSDRWK